jgi:hypothetical protein
VVSFILVGVGRRESHQSLLHFGAGAEVIVDGGGVTACARVRGSALARMRLRTSPTGR